MWDWATKLLGKEAAGTIFVAGDRVGQWRVRFSWLHS